jgi:hypothetical protein
VSRRKKASPGERRRLERKIEQLTRARLLPRDPVSHRREVERTKSGAPTARARKRIEALWDRLGPIVAAPERRPYHVYQPRSKAGRAAALATLGLTAREARGLTAFPIATIAGAGKPRLRILPSGEISFRYRRGLVRGQRVIALDVLADGPPRTLAGLDRAARRGDAVRFRTGPGVWSYLEAGLSSPSQGFAYLAESYDDADDWLTAAEVVEFG